MHDRQWEEIEPHYVQRRPIALRLQQQQLGWNPGEPTDAEKHDAILLLEEPFLDDVGDEAFRILDEYGQ